jgi:hypothetical protein
MYLEVKLGVLHKPNMALVTTLFCDTVFVADRMGSIEHFGHHEPASSQTQ